MMDLLCTKIENAVNPCSLAKGHAGPCKRFSEPIRTFDTGATRDTDTGKYDYEGFLSPLVLERFGQYMHKNRVQKDGSLRASDNWQKGIPLDAYMKSAFRHFMEWWMAHRLWRGTTEVLEDALCAVIFNASGYLHELLKKRGFSQQR